MPKLLATQLLQHVLQASACFLFVEACPSDFIATAFDKSLDILTFDFIIFDVEVLDQTDISIGLGKQEVLADVLKDGPFRQLHDIREVIPSLIPDNGFEIVDVDGIGINVIDDVTEVLDGRTGRIQPQMLGSLNA